MSEITFADVLAYVAQSATPEEVHALVDAGNARVRALRATEAAATSAQLTPGARVELHGLKPKYLNGLTGKFVIRQPSGKATIELDEEVSYRAGRYVGANNQMSGIPISALRILE